MTKLFRVEIESISSSKSRSDFSEIDLDLVAEKILESGGIIKPLVLKKTGFEKYEVVEGHFEYYAAVRAYEKNDHETEVNAVVISPESEEAVLKQVEAFRKLESTNPATATSSPVPLTTTNTNSRLTSLELRFENAINDLKIEQKRDSKKFEDEIKEIKGKMPKLMAPLEVFNTLNIVELTFRLKTTGFGDKKAIKIAESIETERQKSEFSSLSDVVARVRITHGKKTQKAISSDKMVEIIDSWSKISFN
ncbi:MAG: chromosome partitioning protein ParB [Symploca sp. SIO1C4]|uniref:Chromosome partitioning protein ParB n=1 Tax=Symploca sp. SIO1C4 TaxID=2607765 RepID=A0A6B3NCI3_9CYAN|nr:chromosome partitioning protein ParB [Symploca sp. SIO1C4]